MSQMLVGIDVSLQSHHVQFMDGDGGALASFSIHNNRQGADTLIQKIVDTSDRIKSQSLRIGMEATSNLGWHLAHYLQEQLQTTCPQKDTQIYVLNARKVARFKKGYDTLPKNDRIDAWVIADHLRFGRLPHAMKDIIQYEALQRLTRTRFHLMQNITRDKTYFLNQVFLKFSGLRQDNPFSNLFGSTCLAVIQELEPEQIVAMSMEELVDFLKDKGKNRFDNPEEIALYLQKIARSSYRLNKAMADPVNISLATMLNVIKHMESEVKKLDKEIAKIMKGLPQTLTSVKGIGDVFTAGIMAETGDIQRFKDHNALAKYAGLTWNQHQSGEFEAEDTSRTRTGNKYLRYYLIQAADSVRKHVPEYKDFYQKKYDEVPKHKHKRALVLTARKLVRLVFSLLNTRQLYTSPERRG
ncbi:transposase IS116/IS110/IS902 family protein [Desulforamulus reducens MI-1]|uniref:Transposase IS116/IS110/IS902 family protein n=1 Tax=Desulforamulus reducens (strain ATCC BAA-1160 / DSM 100696 / MI-1) TaxID=349161 RepID=A4J0N4_DESRM|nr:IS110 family transposase [Desulforamulus reducens]ABO48637.1 transposase IS116/IS110/IS902 family protein [Desulforamulus reducens MI-1]ABO49308.1 transposase IS116/IS110/IS902 family protein [Desulforamulus reducens MI-1]ABO49984.1 transposase IS116/IS110/IS902 family protein [Desulforamulus reducens MI-1]ABO50152.1 transposase IS116/IS110/IS902 family protein [Desulforamulus reducens MI-1]ABO50430.1 transposase IS116/IS110/IS902 family protein [Desulforamulus reducens MI-1]